MPFRSFFSSPATRRQEGKAGQRPPRRARSVSSRRALAKAGHMKPVLEAGSTFVSGWREMADRLLGMTQTSFERGVDHSRRLVEAGSIHEFLDLQERWVRAGLSHALAEGEKVSTLSAKLLGGAMRPLVVRSSRA